MRIYNLLSRQEEEKIDEGFAEARRKWFQQTITPKKGLSLAWIAVTRLSNANVVNSSF